MSEFCYVCTFIITIVSGLGVCWCVITHPKFLMWLNKKKVKRDRKRINNEIKNRYKD